MEGKNEAMTMDTSTTTSSRQQEEELREGSTQDMYPITPPSNARRRKGIPHRAPFGS